MADDFALHGWTVIALRSATQNAALGRQARASGAGFIGLPALRIYPAADSAAARRTLDAALACTQCVFTSPLAVSHADRLRPLRDYRGLALAVGAGTAAALQQAGVMRIDAPVNDMTSEGLLALPALNPPAAAVGLVGAPGGRGLIDSTLRARGALVEVAHVYRREAGRLDRRHSAAVLAANDRLALLLSSAEALQHALRQLPEPAAARLRQALVVASSERLVELAGRSGFRHRVLAASPRLPDLLAAIAGHAKAGAFR